MNSEETDSGEKVNEADALTSSANQETMESGSEGEEPIVIHKKKKVNRSVLVDSDEESDSENVALEKNLDEQENETNEHIITVGKTNARKRIAILDSSESENEESNDSPKETQELLIEEGNKLTSASAKTKILKNSELLDELFDAEESDKGDNKSDEEKESTPETKELLIEEENKVPSASAKTKILKDSRLLDELFDAEESDEGENESDEERESTQEKTPVAMDEGYHGDHGESEEDDEGPQISEALRQKLAKGAAKKSKASRSQGSKPHRMKKEDVQQIHSESQRIMREREVKMPYHEPKKLDLSVFLARTQQKQEAMKKITPGRWKQPESVLLLKSKCEEQIAAKIENKSLEVNQVHSSDIAETSDKKSEDMEVEQVKKQLNLDDLPDLVIERSSDYADNKIIISASVSKPVKQPRLNMLCGNALQGTDDIASGLIESVCDAVSDDRHFMNIEKDNQESLVVHSNKSDNKLPEHDSGYLTTPLNSSEEESTGSPSESGDSQEKPVVSAASTEIIEAHVGAIVVEKSHDTVTTESSTKSDDVISCENVASGACKSITTDMTDETTNGEVENTNSNVTTPGLDKNGMKPKQRRTPVLAGATLPAPRLSGNPDSFIDLDEGDNADAVNKPKSGVINLMERLMKHSAKRPPKKAQDVEISMVVKETGYDKDELKLDKFTYHIEAEEEEDPALKVPGAKLLKLKEKLREKMTADREKARQLRTQLMDFDNDEDGFEEEAEMTDESDTDDEEEIEEEIEEEEEEEEDLDLEEYTIREKQQKQGNPFLDDEAESEGEEDEDIEESGLHLQLDSLDSKGLDESTSQSDVPKKDFLKSALSKTKSMDLFDEEANTESPTMSQQSSGESNIDISDRPFEQLSQGTQMVPEESNPKVHGSQLPNECGNTNSVSLFKDNSFNTSMDMSFELMGSMIPAGQGTGRKNRPDADSPCSKSSAQSSRRYSVLSLPVENTQDLFTFSETSPTEFTKQTTQSKDLHFHLDESQSRLLDDDGLLKMESTKKSSRRQLLLDEKELTDPDDDMGELLHLCSGRFTENKDGSSKKSLFSGESQLDNSQSMNELMGLCSGQFTGKNAISRSSSVATESSSLLRSDSTEPFLGTQTELLGLCSGTFSTTKYVENDVNNAGISQVHPDDCGGQPEMKSSQQKVKSRKKKRKRIVVGSDNESDGEEDNNSNEDNNKAEDSDDFEVQSYQGSEQGEAVDELESDEEGASKKISGFRKDSKFLQQFVEAEAELSGSEAESDENYDIDEEEDLLEMEEGDNDVTLNQEELRNQVGRVHLKSVIDADKKQIRLMQEMYLKDGDLHSEGGGRQRKFRWRNMGDTTQDDLFRDGSDEEILEDETDHEKWRLQRFEREKFLQEIKENEENTAENATIKLGNVCFKPKKAKSQQLQSTENLVKQSDKDAQMSKRAVQNQTKSAVSAPPGLFKVPAKRAGSFLSRSKTDLAKIAEKSKPMGSVSGPRNSRNFVFQTLSEENKTETSEDKKPAVKRACSTPKQSIAKKPKLEKTSSLPKDSIFNLY